MKTHIINADRTLKICSCGHSIFRKSTKSRYTNKEKTEGLTYELVICDSCNKKEQYNDIKWTVDKSLIALNERNKKEDNYWHNKETLRAEFEQLINDDKNFKTQWANKDGTYTENAFNEWVSMYNIATRPSLDK